MSLFGNTVSILEEAAKKAGWTESEQIELLCEYIDNQQSEEAFADFIGNKAKEDEKDEEDECD